MPPPGATRNTPRRGALILLVAAVAGSSLSGTAAAEDLRWSIYAGRWGVEKEGETSELGVEARRSIGAHGLDLAAGLAATADEAAWVYAGASRGWEISGGWELRPGFAVSFFDEGDGRDLGGPIEFRSSLEVSYRHGRDLRVGLLVYHLSNAGFYDLNPGANSVVLTVGFR